MTILLQCENATTIFKTCSETVKSCATRLQQAAPSCAGAQLHALQSSHQCKIVTSCTTHDHVPSGSLLLRLQALEQQKLGLVAQLHLLQVNSRPVSVITLRPCSMVEIHVLPAPPADNCFSQEQVMLRTAGGEAVCDAVGRLQSRSDHDFVRAVAAQVAADDKVRASTRATACYTLQNYSVKALHP